MAKLERHSGGSDLALPLEEAEVFYLFVRWLYTDCVEHEPHQNDDIHSYDLFEPMEYFERLIKLYFLADRMQTADLMNLSIDVIGKFIQAYQWVFRSEQINLVYEKTKTGSELRRFVVAQCAHSPHTLNWEAAEQPCMQFYIDLARHQSERLQALEEDSLDRMDAPAQRTAEYHVAVTTEQNRDKSG